MAELTVHRFPFQMPNALADFDPAPFIEQSLKWVDSIVGSNEKVALSASGGVDSTTLAFLLKDVLGGRLRLFFINDGFRRIMDGREEYEVTADMFKDFPHFEVIHTRDIVLPWFEGVQDGTMKREMFRSRYTITSNKHIASLGADWIADGTIAPDIVMTDQNRQIQHNVNLPYNMNKLEPLSSLYKPHVRRVAIHLGIPQDFAMRIPCPGPAQLLRVGGAFSAAKLQISKQASDIVEQRVRSWCTHNWGASFHYDEATGVRTPFQYFGTCMDPEMELDADLSELASKALGSDVTCHRMKTQGMWIDPSVKEQARKLYAPIIWIQGPAIEHDSMIKLTEIIWTQKKLPRVLYEVFDSKNSGFPVGIKIVESEDVKTAWPMDVDFEYLRSMGEEIAAQTKASKVAFDISKRPPATIELF
ncbi:MAG TPA: hypothetical protein PKH07_15760 [bacterium]|nr:hypothetical protein [bacterium]